jgi:photosystem II stability/assembly factor-like uncharacterized protein
MLLRILVLLVLVAGTSHAQETMELSWQLQDSGSDASLRGLCVVDENVAWASGTGGTVLRTEDGGATWLNVSVDGADELDFRDLHAIDSKTAVIVNAGQPAVFYRTNDGGESWKKVFQHENENSFFDAIAAISSDHWIVMSDPVDDRILLVESLDQGQTWKELAAERRPLKNEGEAGFAASGSNMIVDKDSGVIYLALGSHVEGKESETSRIMVSDDGAQTWSALNAPMRRNQSSGIFSVVCLPEMDFGDLGVHSGVCVAVGGNYLEPDNETGNLALAGFGELKNSATPTAKPRGFRSGVTYTFIDDKMLLITVGTNGTDISDDAGMTWKAQSDEGFHAVKSTRDGVVWASGADGRIARLVIGK